MDIETLLKIKKDPNLHKYLREHSGWYNLLNKDKENYKLLLKEYKQYKKEKGMEKVNTTIENIELFSNIIKFVD